MLTLSNSGSTGIDATFEALISDDTSSPILLYTKSFTGTNTSYRLPVAEKGIEICKTWFKGNRNRWH